ncbi:hypothetical protein [Solitalea lacus]|uniref:hypothetical protein n=1 Tax=Solitalea lacus TaxID=2911172 RepID=UPI001EDAB1FA|nr:hypothetical protein [Solitalea lacus]UKJ08195.1 hypothetical protein L2B55_03260 [Solitalea lacus]
MIILIGGAEQTGAEIVSFLNTANFNDLVIVHDHKSELENEQLVGKRYTKKIRYKETSRFLAANQLHVQFVIVTSEKGIDYAEDIWNACIKWGIPLIFASKTESKFDELISINSKQPFYWASVRYSEKNSALLPKLVLHLMENRKQPIQIDLNNEAIRLQFEHV